MYAIPLPPRPNLENYKKLAKDLVKACKAGNRDALREWSMRWLEALASLLSLEMRPDFRERLMHQSNQLAEFALHRGAIRAGANIDEADYPTGDERVDELLRRHGAK
jgi:hypothetical protein